VTNVNGVDVDILITILDIGNSPSKVVSKGSRNIQIIDKPSDDAFIHYRIDLVETNTTTLVTTINGPVSLKVEDIDSQGGSDFTEVFGADSAYNVILGSSLELGGFTASSPTDIPPPSSDFDYVRVNPALVGASTNWTDETNTRPELGEPIPPTTATFEFNGFSTGEFVAGITGPSNYTFSRSFNYLDFIIQLGRDTDGDGIADHLDDDSDNDGTPDNTDTQISDPCVPNPLAIGAGDCDGDSTDNSDETDASAAADPCDPNPLAIGTGDCDSDGTNNSDEPNASAAADPCDPNPLAIGTGDCDSDGTNNSDEPNTTAILDPCDPNPLAVGAGDCDGDGTINSDEPDATAALDPCLPSNTATGCNAPFVDLDGDNSTTGAGTSTAYLTTFTEGGAAVAVSDTDTNIVAPGGVIASAITLLTNAQAGDVQLKFQYRCIDCAGVTKC